jgi:hypothetical protein
MRLRLTTCCAAAFALLSGCADAISLPVTAPQPQAKTTIAEVLSGRPAGTVVRGDALKHAGSTHIRFCGWTPPGPAPLYVVDGVAVDSAGLVGMAIDPVEIVTLTIEKGPSALVRYGPKADHGVVIVTTRRATTR